MAARPLLILALGAAVATGAAALWAEQPPAAPFTLERVAEGVYAALQPEAERFNDANATVIVTDRDVVVIDAQAAKATVRALIAAIGELTDKPIRYLVNSHWHGDHTFGNQVYRDLVPGIVIVAHDTVPEDLEQRAMPKLAEEIAAYETAIAAAEQRLADGVDRAGNALDEAGEATLAAQLEAARGQLADKRASQAVPPAITFGERMTLRRSARSVELMHFTAHTRGDVVAYLPAEKVLVSGDLLDELPFGGHGYPSSWIATLDTLEALDFAWVIPGHGPVMAGKAQLRLVRELLRAAVERVAAAVAAGQDLEAVKAAVDLADFRPRLVGDDAQRGRAFDGFVPALIERAFAEATGTLE